MRWHYASLTALGLILCALLNTGCGTLGYVAANLPKSEDAKYKGLAKQKVAVMVWADRGTRIDYPNLQLDTGNTIQAQLISKADEADVKEIQFPWEVRRCCASRRSILNSKGAPITEYAHRISGITRLIYVEVGDFSTRSDTAVQLLRGSMNTNVKVVEIGNGTSKVVYEINNLNTLFPPKQKEGVIDKPEA